MAEPIKQLRAVADAAAALRKAFDEHAAFSEDTFRPRLEPDPPEATLSNLLEKATELNRATERCFEALWTALDSLSAAERAPSTRS